MRSLESIGHLSWGHTECDALLKTNKVVRRPEYLCALSYIPLHRQRGGLFATRQLLRAKDNL
jgi:hypothetical protein